MTAQEQTVKQGRSKGQKRNASRRATELVQIIQEDHARLRNLIGEYRNTRKDDQTSLPGEIGELAKMILYMVALHEAAEEDTLYISLQDQMVDTLLINRMLDEQQKTRQDIEALMDKQPASEGYEQRLMEIIGETEQHMEDEEAQLFPILEKLSLSESREIAGEYIKYRQELENLRI